MAWTTPSDHPASVVSVAEWNAFHGTAGNCAHLKNLADAPMKAQGNGGTIYGGRAKLNFVAGANITATVVDDPGNNRVNITLASAGGSLPTQAATSIQTVTTSATQSAKGPYTQMFASAGFAVMGLILYVYDSNEFRKVDISVGAAGSETVKIPDLYCIGGMPRHHFPFSIPDGSRIAIRASNESTAYARTFTVCLTVLG